MKKAHKLTVRRPGQKKHETTVEYLWRVASNLKFESCIYLDDLPCVEAVLEFFELWHAYDTDLMIGIIEAIEDGASAKHYNDFVKRWQLPWGLYINKKWVTGDTTIPRVGRKHG